MERSFRQVVTTIVHYYESDQRLFLNHLSVSLSSYPTLDLVNESLMLDLSSPAPVEAVERGLGPLAPRVLLEREMLPPFGADSSSCCCC